MTETAKLEALTRPIIGIENRTAQEVFDIMADRFRHAALSVSRPAVKGLEWHGPDLNGDVYAKSLLGTYTVRARQGSLGFWLTQVGGYHPTLGAAQTAAQTHFDKAVLCTLSSLSPPSGGWRDIASYSGHGGALVSRPSDRFFYEPLSAFKDATGVWRVLGSKGGMTKVKFDPTHWQPLPSPPEAE